jgi:hypothetical protein
MPAKQLCDQLYGRCGISIHDRPDQMAIGSVEGHLYACDGSEPCLARRTGWRTIQDHLAGLRHIARREVAHDYNSTPMKSFWPAHSGLDVLC